MRILQLHCDYVEYTPIKKEIASAETLEEKSTRRFEDIVVAFITVEKGDDANVSLDATNQIKKSIDKIGCTRLLLYPYSHLGSDLSSPQVAIDMLHEMEQNLHGIGLDVHHSPFGWTKSYSIKVKGHPLSESFKHISKTEKPSNVSNALKSELNLESDWCILDTDGHLVSIREFDFTKHKKLEALAKYESAKKRTADQIPPHVPLMKKLAIADYEPASDKGNMRFYPNGRLIKSLIERYVTEQVIKYGGSEVETPLMYDSKHPSMVSYFNRFPARQYNIDSEGKNMFLRFAACFGQFLMAEGMQMSYKNLPYRLYELTRYSFRREQSGELVGLRRLRAFTMPDCHAFCADMDQAVMELGIRFDLSRRVIHDLGIGDKDYEMAIRFTRDFYKENKTLINGMVKKHDRPVLVEMWKERFFYFVLKWEFNYVDKSGKASALSTDQIDVENGARYGIEFVDEQNNRRNPIILHNSPSGAVERIIYALLENAAANSELGVKPTLPIWLCPTQVRVIPVNAEFDENAKSFAQRLTDDGIRVDVDDRNESMGRRIREAEKDWIPYTLVLGKKEVESGDLSVRDRRTSSTSNISFEQFLKSMKNEIANMPYAPLNSPLLLSRRPQIML
ncbi:MAG: threonine--tRNA ligase [Cenarchaeum symbiont of Oopsacas minuta]|nr:threonine--tRNA ligase [Cenarchaeum symbiont of Oopsacas minuta]